MPPPQLRHFDGNSSIKDGTATIRLNELIDAVNALNAEIESLRPVAGTEEAPPRHFFFARLTARAVTDGRWEYAWEEVHKQGTGYGEDDETEWITLAGGRSGTVDTDPAMCFEDEVAGINNAAAFFDEGVSYGLSPGSVQLVSTSPVSLGLREMLPNMLEQIVQMHVVNRWGALGGGSSESTANITAEFWFHKSIDKTDDDLNTELHFVERPDALLNTLSPIDTQDLDADPQPGYVRMTFQTGTKRMQWAGHDTIMAYYRPIVLPIWIIRHMGDEWRAPLFILDDDCT